MQKIKKNQFLELLRFIFCLIIIIHHSGFVSKGASFRFMYGGQYAVEFFFLLTGAFAMQHLSDGAPKDGCMKYSVEYTVSKLKRVFPYAAIGIVLCYIWYFIQADYSKGLKDTLWGRWNILYELCFLPMSGIMDLDLNNYLNSPLWYLSVVLLGLPLVMFIAIKWRDLFTYYLSWVLPLLLHAFLLEKYGTIAGWGTYTGFVYFGVIRGIADMMLGCFLYTGSKKINSLKINKTMAFILEILCFVFSIYMFSSNVNEGYTYEFATMIMALGISISLSGKSLSAYAFGLDEGSLLGKLGRLFGHLGKLSLPMYCLHWPVYRFVSEYGEGLSYITAVLLTFVIVVAVSEMLFYFLGYVKRLKRT